MTGFEPAAWLAVLMARPGMLVMATPFLGGTYAPIPARIGLTVLLALVLAPFVQVPQALPGTGLAIVILREVAIGLALAFAIRVLIFAADFAGNFSSYQVGLSIGALIDPQTGVRNNVLAMLYANLAIIICLLTNLHHTLLRALAESYTALPVGVGGISDGLAGSVAGLLGLVFVFGVRLAAPVVTVLLLVELGLALVARIAPSLNVIVAGAPVRLLVGLLAVAAALTALPSLLSRYGPVAFQLAADTARAFR